MKDTAFTDGFTAHMKKHPQQIITNLENSYIGGMVLKYTVLVGHDDPFEAATGIYPEPMGVTYIIQPQGSGRFEVKAFINPDDWQKLNLK